VSAATLAATRGGSLAFLRGKEGASVEPLPTEESTEGSQDGAPWRQAWAASPPPSASAAPPPHAPAPTRRPAAAPGVGGAGGGGGSRARRGGGEDGSLRSGESWRVARQDACTRLGGSTGTRAARTRLRGPASVSGCTRRCGVMALRRRAPGARTGACGEPAGSRQKEQLTQAKRAGVASSYRLRAPF